jgi:hypothetical protein
MAPRTPPPWTATSRSPLAQSLLLPLRSLPFPPSAPELSLLSRFVSSHPSFRYPDPAFLALYCSVPELYTGLKCFKERLATFTEGGRTLMVVQPMKGGGSQEVQEMVSA